MSSFVGSPAAPVVTVVIPTYNHRKFLPEAIDSVLAQSEVAARIVVVDDGSADHPDEIVAKYSGVHLIRQSNQGLSAARNTGLGVVETPFVLFLDADDRLTAGAITAQLELFERHPECGFVYGAYRMFGTDPAWQSDCALKPAGRNAYRAFLAQNCIGMHGTVLYRTDVIRKIGGFDASLNACEDYDAYLRIARHHPVACTPQVLAEYRQHKSNMSGNPVRMVRAALKVLKKQQHEAQARPDWHAAYQRGLRDWPRYYAGLQLRKMRKALKSPNKILPTAVETLAFLAEAPGAVFRLLADKVDKRLHRRFGFRTGRMFSGLGMALSTGPTRVSTEFGFDRGLPVDRVYIEEFLAANADLVRGDVLEVGDTAYTDKYGGDRVVSAEAFHRNEGWKYHGDFATEHNLPDNAFDCIILTQTLHLIFDMPAALRSIYAALKPGGVALITLPWASPIDEGEWSETWYWSVSPAGLRKLLETQFPPEEIDVDYYGNALSASAFLYGVAANEVRQEDMQPKDPYCPVVVAGVARKPL